MNTRSWTGSAVLLATLVLTAGSLVAWKRASARKADAAAARQPEPVESITLAVARGRQYRPTTTSVGTVLALTSRSEEHTSELQSPYDLVCRLLLEKKNKRTSIPDAMSLQRHYFSCASSTLARS